MIVVNSHYSSNGLGSGSGTQMMMRKTSSKVQRSLLLFFTTNKKPCDTEKETKSIIVTDKPNHNINISISITPSLLYPKIQQNLTCIALISFNHLTLDSLTLFTMGETRLTLFNSSLTSSLIRALIHLFSLIHSYITSTIIQLLNPLKHLICYNKQSFRPFFVVGAPCTNTAIRQVTEILSSSNNLASIA